MEKKTLVTILIIVAMFIGVAYADTVDTEYDRNLEIPAGTSGFVHGFDETTEGDGVIAENYVDLDGNGVTVTFCGFKDGKFIKESTVDWIDGRIIERRSDGNTYESYHHRLRITIREAKFNEASFEYLPVLVQVVLPQIGSHWTQYLLDQSMVFKGESLISMRMEMFDESIHVLVVRYLIGPEDSDWFGVYVNTLTRHLTLCKTVEFYQEEQYSTSNYQAVELTVQQHTTPAEPVIEELQPSVQADPVEEITEQIGPTVEADPVEEIGEIGPTVQADDLEPITGELKPSVQADPVEEIGPTVQADGLEPISGEIGPSAQADGLEAVG